MRGGWAGAYFKHFFKPRVQQIFQWGNSKNNAFEEAQAFTRRKQMSAILNSKNSTWYWKSEVFSHLK